MSNAPVVSVTDELIAELSAEAAHDDGTRIPVSSGKLRALLAERDELKRDAERLEWWFSKARERTPDAVDVTIDQWRASLDAAMKS